MPFKVPIFNSLWSGTTHPVDPRRRMTWRPRWRLMTKSNVSGRELLRAPKRSAG